jgi:isoleucyl-tRNA synthetase
LYFELEILDCKIIACGLYYSKFIDNISCCMHKKTHHYPNVESNASLPKIEKKILAFWQENDIFQKSVDRNNKYEEFIFYDGPPFANGLPHYGHLLTGFIKDTYARYQTMKGKKVERRFGWDCHGLPAEMAAEKELGVSGRSDITKFGIDKFNNQCKESVMKYEGLWEEYVNRQGRWVDFKNSYKTMDKNFMESVIWAFAELHKKGLIYEAMKVMPYSWACQTPLSNFETRLDNSYRERADKAVTISFVLEEKPKSAPSGFDEYRILAWTTTPWTLPSNLALAIGKDIEYVYVPAGKICYIIAKFALEKYKNELSTGHCEEAARRRGNPESVAAELDCHTSLTLARNDELLHLRYKPLFKYFHTQPNAFKILIGDFVTEGDGTGIVHIAPGFGEDDQVLCAQHNIDLVCPVDNAGKFTSEVPDFQDLQVFDANDKIIIKLKEQGNWLKTEQILHNYPHCWRTDTPLIYKAVPSWYVKVSAFKDRMCELNRQINWIPEHVKDGLFGKWLENARDWAISRNRFWGSPIPVWRSSDPTYPRMDVYGSIEELERDFGVKVEDLHRPFIDDLTRPNPDDPTGKSVMRRVEDVFDCWFESGSMPYAQVHYPFENKAWFEDHFPADFIVEYAAQTRGWFYTLMVLSTALFDRPPFLNCICHGVILDSTGQKLSKRLNNYADPLEIFDQYGSDALRVLMLSAGVVKGAELLIDKDNKSVRESLRLMIKPIWNAYNFFTLYANADGIKAELLTNTLPVSLRANVSERGNPAFVASKMDCRVGSDEPPRNDEKQSKLDSYILIKLKLAINAIDKELANFDSTVSLNAIDKFFELLNNWYIRRSRNRFWKSQQDQDKINAYNTLYTCLVLMSRAMAPLIPFLAEEIYRSLTSALQTIVIASEHSERGNPACSEGEMDCRVGLQPPRNDAASVHLTDFPDVSFIEEDAELVGVMDQVLDICNSGLFIRNSENIRIRQPLASITIVTTEDVRLNPVSFRQDEFKDEAAERTLVREHSRDPRNSLVSSLPDDAVDFEDLIKDELNIKAVKYLRDLANHAERRLSLNFQAIGKRLPAKMKEIIAANKQGKWREEGGALLIAGEVLNADEFEVVLSPRNNIKGAKALSGNNGLIILDLEITKELYHEGLARDLIRFIQQARKDAGFDITDRILLEIERNELIGGVLKEYQELIEEQTLSKIEQGILGNHHSSAINLENHNFTIKLQKVGM